MCKVEINLKACRHCKFFKCETEERFCSLNNEWVGDYELCDSFVIAKDVLKKIRTDYDTKFVKVLK